MELRQLRYFVAVAEELNFRRAAERLHVSQPSLSQQIMALERELGGPLLVRDSRHVELTEAGRQLLPEARRTLQQARRARETVRRAARGELGLLRIGQPAFGSSPIARRITAAFSDAYPEIELVLTGAPTADLLARLEGDALDVAFVRLPVELGPGFDVRVIERDPIVALLPAGHRYSTSESLEMREMDGERIVVAPRDVNPALYDLWHDRRWPEAGVTFSAERVEASLEGIIAAVAEGWGFSALPSVLIDLYRVDGLIPVPFRDPEAVTELGVAWNGIDTRSAVKLFLQECDQVVQG